VCVAVALVREYCEEDASAGVILTPYLRRTFGPRRRGFVTGVLMLFGAYLLLFPFRWTFFGNFVFRCWARPNVAHLLGGFRDRADVVEHALGVDGVKPSCDGLTARDRDGILTVFRS